MLESVMELLKYHLQAHLLSSFQRRSESSHFLPWWGASSQALFSHATLQLGLVKWLLVHISSTWWSSPVILRRQTGGVFVVLN